MFLEKGRTLTWFAQPLQHADTPVIQRMLRIGSAAARQRGIEVKGWSPSVATDETKTEAETETDGAADMLLFCRLPNEPYVGCGRLALRAVDLSARPLRFLWQLCDFDALQQTEGFVNLVPDAAPSAPGKRSK